MNNKIFSVLVTFSVISWSSMSSALATSDIEGSSSWVVFSAMACRAVTLPLGMSKSKSLYT